MKYRAQVGKMDKNLRLEEHSEEFTSDHHIGVGNYFRFSNISGTIYEVVTAIYDVRNERMVLGVIPYYPQS